MSEEAKPAEHADAVVAVQEEPGAGRSTDASNEPPLQFEKADFDEAPSCANCSQPIATMYYQVGTALVCASCRELVIRAIDAGKGSQRFFRAALYGRAQRRWDLSSGMPSARPRGTRSASSRSGSGSSLASR